MVSIDLRHEGRMSIFYPEPTNFGYRVLFNMSFQFDLTLTFQANQ